MINWVRWAMLKAVTPLLKRVNQVHLPTKKITSKQYREIKELLKPGMVFLTRMDWNLTNVFIPCGPYKHGAICADLNTVIEAVGSGVVKTDLIDFLLTKDQVCILAPKFADTHEMNEAAGFASRWVGLPYDYEFKSKNKAFYCFELVFAAYRQARLARKSRDPATVRFDWDLRSFLGEPTVTADDFLKAEGKWAVIWRG